MTSPRILFRHKTLPHVFKWIRSASGCGEQQGDKQHGGKQDGDKQNGDKQHGDKPDTSNMHKILDLDMKWIDSIKVDDADIKSKVESASFSNKDDIAKKTSEEWLKKALNCIDLSALVGDETPETTHKLCQLAAFPLKGVQLPMAAVCVYPVRIQDAVISLSALRQVNKVIKVASVAAGFPSGSYPLHSRLAEIYYAVAEGADEIDIVIDRSLVLRDLWPQLYSEIKQMREACGHATLKVILSVVECGSWTNVYKASVVAMLAGADFIKTSTGKEGKTMTIQDGYVMCQAIKEFKKKHNLKVGLKPAGGVRTTEQAISWLMMVQQELGDEWLDNKKFRIGTGATSSLIAEIAKGLKVERNVFDKTDKKDNY